MSTHLLISGLGCRRTVAMKHAYESVIRTHAVSLVKLTLPAVLPGSFDPQKGSCSADIYVAFR